MSPIVVTKKMIQILKKLNNKNKKINIRKHNNFILIAINGFIPIIKLIRNINLATLIILQIIINLNYQKIIKYYLNMIIIILKIKILSKYYEL